MIPNPIRYRIYTGDDPLPEPFPYDYVLARQGVIKRAATPHFEMSMVVANGAQIAGLERYPVGLDLRLPLIPEHWLHRIFEHAKQCGSIGSVPLPIEQMYYFHWIFDRGWRWQVQVPTQKAGAASVHYRGGDAPSIVLELHSHHSMPAYFSDVDNRDEQGCRFYAVIGRLYEHHPEIRLRLGMYGDFMELSPLMLFGGWGPFMEAT